MRGVPGLDALAAPPDPEPPLADEPPSLDEVPPSLEDEEEYVPDPVRPLVAPESEPLAPETEPLDPDPDASLVALVTVPVKLDATVVCERTVETAEVTVPIGSVVPAMAAALHTPPSRSAAHTSPRITAGRIPIVCFPTYGRPKLAE